ncbi:MULTISPECIES: SCO family protein [Spiribacter]|jgi:protein SCO1/2|uniref:SCO family protein n=1 Tax=Spiribacter aquaticus TaxID=1935996 RepID=A0A557RN39_9GAMM|nr:MULTISPECIES: SCO family protein [Spiribacter]PZA01045.1 SCO family protein [Gammaproteobacteria bacterium 2W06]AUB77777.1 cytochrome c oxidase assembly protein [Spiribacter roseus]KAF0279634.1 cytochrome c oxidase assembly protein [Spiribacter roseus]KAF0281800.1 cytochrome c oxidase assembly protein [Spiribacter roseus]KAF0283107.1 cytochrome c oxidase assembly protein [Spiribacter roseus]
MPEHPRKRRWPGPALVVMMAALLSACGGSGYQTKGIEGLLPDLAFRLTSETGETLTAADLRGAPTVVFFGFTHCPDVCPTAMARIAAATEAAGESLDGDLQVLFVSVDPGRDTPQRLADYTDFFSDRVTGATAPVERLRELTKRYRATFGYGEPNEFGDYNVSHSSAMYVFDAEGHARALFRPSDSVTGMAADLRRIARG